MASFSFTLWCPSESNPRNASKFSAEHMTNPTASFPYKNNTHVLLFCQFKELIVGDLFWPNDVQDFSKTRCVEFLQLFQVMQSFSSLVDLNLRSSTTVSASPHRLQFCKDPSSFTNPLSDVDVTSSAFSKTSLFLPQHFTDRQRKAFQICLVIL